MALSAKDGSIQESQVTQSNDSGETLELPEDMDGMNLFIVNDWLVIVLSPLRLDFIAGL